MRASIRSTLPVLLLAIFMAAPLAPLLAAPALGSPSLPQDVNPIAALRADRWSDAQAEAATYADPVAEKLVLYFRLRAPGAATPAEIADFMQRNPDWPAQDTLERRRQEAIALDLDEADVLAQCTARTPTLGGTMLRCAEALANGGRAAEADDLARQAWVDKISDANAEGVFLRRWAGVASADDQWARFERLAWSDASAAARQIVRLDPAHHHAAEVRLAVKRDDPQADALVATLSPALRDDPGLMLDRARSARRLDRDAEALALWRQSAAAAQRAAPTHIAEFWAERNALGRKLLKDGDKAGAYDVIAGHGQTAGAGLLDAEFLAGFIALRLLNDPNRAEGHFQTLEAASSAAITQSRAHYWLARVAAAQKRDPKPEYARAAAWPTTYYGQLAALALGDTQAALLARITALRDPDWTRDTVLAFTGHEVLRAAAWLIAWGDYPRARIFLQRMDELAPIPAERGLVAAFALKVGMPDSAVSVARRMGRDGLALPNLGWPIPFSPPAPPDPGFSLGIMRQESSFDIGAVSVSGARGLMQLMPPTAAAVGRELGITPSIPSLTVDASLNMRLGTTYLEDVLTRFDRSLPLAAAAYNAGPHRVAQWLTDNGDPRIGPVDMVDWIELIPIDETRNYVQRVTENVTMYRAHLNDPTPVLATPWTR